MAGTDTVHVVDDDEAVRESLKFLLESAGLAVRLYDSAEAFLAEAASGEPVACVLTDVRMPGANGLELQQRLNRMAVPASVVVMTGHGEVPVAVRAMKQGAVDFLEKPFDATQLLGAVRRALAVQQARAEAAFLRTEAAERLALLTPREREVLDWLVAGEGSKGIAQRLGSSPRTVEVQRTRVMAKMQARSLPELVRLSQAARADGPGPPH